MTWMLICIDFDDVDADIFADVDNDTSILNDVVDNVDVDMVDDVDNIDVDVAIPIPMSSSDNFLTIFFFSQKVLI